jgi:iron complex outermembrane receptor protein
MYAMMNYFKTDTYASFTPLGFNGTPTPPRASTVTAYNVLLPVYVCSTGVGTQSGLNTGCDATNGTLNPYNPYAAQGLRAQAYLRSPYGRTVDTSAKAMRVALGLDGSFGDDWRYSAAFTASEVGLNRIQQNYLIPQRIMDVVARGTFDFSDPYATPKDVWDYIAPDNKVYSPSRLWQIQATIAKDLMDLAGGPLQAALGASYREESINAPSGNPANDSAPYTRYYSVNSVGTAGSRDVTSAYFEIDAPVLESLELIASGRFDDYSSGQSNFSPKIGFKFTPIDMLTFRGTYSEGFRIPSFNEAYGLPTTGYVTRSVDCNTYAAFCAAHGGAAGTGYYNNYSLGLTQTGDPALDPEKSKSMTVGLIFQPMNNLNMTLDLWQIKVDGLITGVTSTSAAEAEYYANNGVVNLPGITVLPGTPDAAFPNALPVLGFIQSSYTNQDSQKVSGVDIGVNYRMPLGEMVTWTSSLDASYLAKYELKTDSGDTFRYDGTLSPCNITSCSGAPDWRASWQNSFQIRDTTVSLTAYYTAGVDTASVDFGGVKGDCQANADNGASTVAYVDGTPVSCKSSAVWNADLTVRHQLNDQVTLYADVLNVFGIDPPFDPAAAYGLYGFNPAWAGPNIMGRYFRLGFKLDFE